VLVLALVFVAGDVVEMLTARADSRNSGYTSKMLRATGVKIRSHVQQTEASSSRTGFAAAVAEAGRVAAAVGKMMATARIGGSLSIVSAAEAFVVFVAAEDREVVQTQMARLGCHRG